MSTSGRSTRTKYRMKGHIHSMKLSPAGIGLAAIVVLTTSGGLIYGRLSHRWGHSQLEVDAASRLEQIPQRIDNWQSSGSTHLPDYARNELECAGDIVRQYSDAESGTQIGVTLVAGPVGTIAVHSPEICFSSQNYQVLGEREKVTLRDDEGTEHTFWAVDFETKDLEAQRIRVYYAWSVGGPWSAPDDPRISFLGNPYLYKIQLVAPLVASEENKAQDPLPPFLRLLLPRARDELARVGASD